MDPRDERRLYRDLAWTWPIISPPDDYVGEAEEFRSLIVQHGRTARTLLHLGCGGGHLDRTLKAHFRLTSVDISLPMLALARNLNPEVEYHEGDLRTVRLGRTFDAVMAADSMDYMLTAEDLGLAFQTAFEHLRPGGVFVTEAEFTPETLRSDWTRATTHERGDTVITFIENLHDPDPEDTTFEVLLLFLIRHSGQLRIEADRHLNGVIPTETWLRLLAEAGFEATQLAGTPRSTGEPPTPMFVAVRPIGTRRPA